MKIRNCTRPSLVLKGRLTVLLVAVCGLSALSLVSCRSNKLPLATQSTLTSDSVVVSETREIVPVIVPASTTQVKTTVDVLNRLPEGAVLTSSSGRATVTATKGKDDNVTIRADCDSVMVLNEKYLKEIHSLRAQLTEKTTPVVTNVLTWWQTLWVWCGKIAVVLTVVYVGGRFATRKFFN